MKGVKTTRFIASVILLLCLIPLSSCAKTREKPPIAYMLNTGVTYSNNPSRADPKDTQTANDFLRYLIEWEGKEDKKEDKKKDEKESKKESKKDKKKKKYSDPWPWGRDPRRRDGRRYPWGWHPDWKDPAGDVYESSNSEDELQAQQEYEEEVDHKVQTDSDTPLGRRYPDSGRRDRNHSTDNWPAPSPAPWPISPDSGNTHHYDDYYLVILGFIDWYNTFGLPIPGLDGLVNILKPNIYLYSDVPQDVTVGFLYPELVTASIPDYGSGWSVGVSKGGTLKDESGSYGFLFYESQSCLSDFQTEKGFRLDTENRERQLEDILDLYGFNETEKADFIEFWTHMLDPNRVYAMYPQGTDTLNDAMPVIINPKPDSVFRLWFGFEATDKAPEAPDIETITRSEFTLVEWGGFIICQ